MMWSGPFLGEAAAAIADVNKILIRRLLIHAYSMGFLVQPIL